MRQFACRYAIVQFLPFAETGEFANVGIVLACPQTGYFGFKLQTRRVARVNGFFAELKSGLYRTSVKTFERELLRVSELVSRAEGPHRADVVRDVFTRLVHPREAIVRFGPARAVLAESPEIQLSELFDHYVNRSFATPEYVERTMTKRLQVLLRDLQLTQPFRPERIGDLDTYATFPLVQKRGANAYKIIKPFNLTQDEPNGIFEHGDAWVTKLGRLRERKLLPPEILFAVASPSVTESKRHAAAQEIIALLRGQNVKVIDEKAEDQIAEFAVA